MNEEMINLYLKNCKPINSGSDKLIENIKKEGKIVLKLVFLFVTAIMVNSSLFLPWTGDEDKIMFPIHLSKLYFGDGSLGIFLQVCIYLCIFHSAYTASTPMFATIYFMLQIKYQLTLLIENVERLNLDQNVSEFVIYDVNFQRKLKKRLVSCIRHHQGIKRFKRKLDELFYVPTFILSLSVVMLETSLIVFCLSKIRPSSNYRMICTWSLTTLQHTLYALVGQTIIDESERLYMALKCSNWYNWDKQNCRLLTIFLIHTQEPMQITSSGIIVVSKELILKSYKVLYSLITFYKSMSTKNHTK